MTNLTEALSNPPHIKPRRVTIILDDVTEEEREALTTALASPDVWSAESLAKTLSALVSPISASSVKRYRREVLGL